MEFIKYPKIHRLGKEETDGILDGTCVIQEKVDGANTSIWMSDGELQCGSRNRHLIDDDFNGFVSYARVHEGIKSLLDEHPDYRLYGEWLVKHTISYNELSYRKFYLFDIMDSDGNWVDSSQVRRLADWFNIDRPVVFDAITNPTADYLKRYVGESAIGPKGEGIVIRNEEFTNRFGDRCLAKMVIDSFREEASVAFGGNDKHAEAYWELYVMNKYVTGPRVNKICNKLQPMVNERLDMKHIPRVNEMVWHDILQEEIYEISKKVVSLDFKRCKNLCAKKTKMIYVEILEKM